MIQIRGAREADRQTVHAVHAAAFGRSAEADLTIELWAREPACISLVAEQDGGVVGHVLFSPVSVEGRRFPLAPPFALGPLGVFPGRQRGGVGSALCRAGIDACRKAGVPFLVVLGHPTYYPRFGFVPAVRFGLTFADAPALEAFMALELEPGALARASGKVRYAPEFGAV